MISVEEARRRILERLSPVGIEHVNIVGGRGRVLAEDLHAKRAQPPAAVSSMDGYAVRAADLREPGKPLLVIGESRAGGELMRPLDPGETARIFTGAPLPEGADSIAIQENAHREGERVSFTRAVREGEFVRPRGLDFQEGWRGLESGMALAPQHLALAAAMGHGWLKVRRKPRVAVLATGDELVPPGVTPGPTGVVSSNTLLVSGLVEAWGGEVLDLGIAGDDPQALADSLDGLGAIDFLVTSGGASVGDYDLVQKVLGAHGLQLDFWKIAMRPGKPLIYGHFNGTPLLGLPGNPVSSAVCSIIFLRAAIRRLLALPPDLPMRRARLAAALPANDEREEYMRGTILAEDASGLMVDVAARQDSSMLATFARAEVLLRRMAGAPSAQAGEEVQALRLSEVCSC